MVVLFITRILLYLIVMGMPYLHPGVVVHYDIVNIWMWFALVPVEIVAAFMFQKMKKKIIPLGIAAGLYLITLFFITGFSETGLLCTIAAVGAFVLTFSIFVLKIRVLAVIEIFFLAYIYYKLINFSRTSEDIAQASFFITQLLFFLTILAFLLHSVVIYRAAFTEGHTKRNVKEFTFFGGFAAIVLLVVFLVLPPDFINHNIVPNDWNEVAEIEPQPLDEGDEGDRITEVEGADQGNGSEDGENSLEGIESTLWDQYEGDDGGKRKQKAVMVVAAKGVEDLYLAEGYFGDFDPVQGFRKTLNFQLNKLKNMRLIESMNIEPPRQDRKRRAVNVHMVSVMSERSLPYSPLSVDPTIYNMQYFPFNYTNDAVSMVSYSTPTDWQWIRELPEDDKEDLAEYLELPLDEQTFIQFAEYLEGIFEEGTRTDTYFGKIYAILQSFSTCQYSLGFQPDDVTVAKMAEFLFEKQEGDCTEFSNTAAILGRMAGIPSRVVTGWLASKALQTPAHMRGLKVLQESIPDLQQYPLDNLFLVTTTFRHSWVQYYIPGYGWIDFESTSFSKPPPPGGMPHNLDVVIPVIQMQPPGRPRFEMPWGLIGRIAAIVAASFILALYLFKLFKMMYLGSTAAKEGRMSLQALYRLLLMKLALEGFKIKDPSQTPLEYSEEYRGIKNFALVYDKLRYKERFREGEKESLWTDLKDASSKIIKQSRRKGLGGFFKRIFSLRGLFY